MKLELKTDNKKYSNSISHIFKTIFIVFLVIIFSDVAFKLGIISRHYKIDHICRLLAVEKSSINFEKLSKISNLKSKQKIWEFCRQVVK